MNLGDGKWTPLMLAADRGFENYVELLMERKADLNRTDDFERETALMKAARNGFARSLSVLLNTVVEQPRMVNKKNRDGKTALMLAAWYGHTECVELLLKAKAIVNMGDNYQSTALTLAADEGYPDCVQKLLEGGWI